jgi:hypothetical protein
MTKTAAGASERETASALARASTPAAVRPPIEAIYDLSDVEVLRVAARRLPRPKRLREALIEIARAELVHLSSQTGLPLPRSTTRELQAADLVYSLPPDPPGPRSPFRYRPTLLGIYAARFLVSAEELTRRTFRRPLFEWHPYKTKNLAFHCRRCKKRHLWPANPHRGASVDESRRTLLCSCGTRHYR